MKELMTIVRDRREQLPYTFENKFYREHGVHVVEGTVGCGDYCVHTADGQKASVERKTLDDLTNCCGNDRERFLNEIKRALAYRAFAIVCETSWQDIRHHRYRSQILPQSVFGLLFAIQSRYQFPVIFAQDRKGGEYATWQFLRQFQRGAESFDKEATRRVCQAQAQEEARRAVAIPKGMVADDIFGAVKPLTAKPAAEIRA